MRFFVTLSQAVGKPERKSLTLFVIGFVIVADLVAFTFATTTWVGVQQETMDAPSFIVGLSVFLMVGTFAVIANLVALTVFAGREEIIPLPGGRHAGEVRRITLLGFEMLREEHSPWQQIEPEEFSAIDPEVAWSWTALEGQKGLGAEAAPQIILAAVWNLVALKLVKLQARKEVVSMLSGILTGPAEVRIYALPLSAPSPVLLKGAWENRLWASLSKKNEAGQMELFGWIVDAFGDTVGNPKRTALKYTEEDYVRNGWGHFTGIFIKELIWEPRPAPLALWPHICKYRRSQNFPIHAIDNIMAITIVAALKNRVDSD